MTKLLLRLFVKDHQKTESPEVRARIGRLSGAVGIAANGLLCLFKLIVGAVSGSVSIMADALNNLSDAASAIVTLVGFKLAGKPADARHPYGHARYEYLSGLAVAGLIVVIGFELAISSVRKILQPAPVQFGPWTAVILAGSVLLKLWLMIFNRKLGRLIGSNALLVTAQDSRNDVLTTSAVLLASLVERMTGLQIDGYMGLAVAAFILYSGITMAKQTVSPLLGESASPELRQKIQQLVEQESLVLGYHDLMVHDYGPGRRFASIHVEMDGQEDPLLCHEVIDHLEHKCLRRYQVDLVIHYDPVITGDRDLDALRGYVLDALTEQDPRLTLHDFRKFPGRSHINVMFDVALPQDLLGRQAHLTRCVEEALERKNPGAYHAHITYDLET